MYFNLISKTYWDASLYRYFFDSILTAWIDAMILGFTLTKRIFAKAPKTQRIANVVLLHKH